ncbi:hypothetical protein [Pantoea ananatis]|uniref:hypothetical protein n=1 Tax=Pantoea ananas TaxID=553 RepID=UPI000F89A13D|nr:hypothetical protein [Pantoea ananatis]RQN03395.1 hypothetical protein EHQ51_00360 [Pantoea ananatis]
MSITTTIKNLYHDRWSLTSVITSLIFYWVFFYLRINDNLEAISNANLIYCALAVVALLFDRFKKGIFNERQSKTIAFAFTVTPLGAAILDFLYGLPNWENTNAAMFALLFLLFSAVWLIMYLIIYKWHVITNPTKHAEK